MLLVWNRLQRLFEKTIKLHLWWFSTFIFFSRESCECGCTNLLTLTALGHSPGLGCGGLHHARGSHDATGQWPISMMLPLDMLSAHHWGPLLAGDKLQTTVGRLGGHDKHLAAPSSLGCEPRCGISLAWICLWFFRVLRRAPKGASYNRREQKNLLAWTELIAEDKCVRGILE